MVFESNGGYGQHFGRALAKLRYPWIYRDANDAGRTTVTGDRLGWHSNREKKLREFEALRAAMAAGEYTDPSREGLEQKLEIVHYEEGGCGPAGLVHLNQDARSLHSDIVTADALSLLGATRLGSIRPTEAPPPAGSAAWRRKHQDTIIARKPKRAAERKRPSGPNPFLKRAKRLV